MTVALLAALIASGGSIAGFGLTIGVSGAPATDRAATVPALEDVVVRGTDRDCPKALRSRRA